MVVPFAKTGEVQNAEKERQKEKIAYVLCGILAVVLFSGCQSTAADGTDEKVFVYGDTTFNAENDESDVNPHNGYSGWACIRYGIGETLFHYSDSMEIEPWLAESYELVDDTTWRITLHEGISFTSGRTRRRGGQRMSRGSDRST